MEKLTYSSGTMRKEAALKRRIARQEQKKRYRHLGLKRFYIALIFIFMYAPIVLLIIQSFNRSKSRGHWGGFTLKWYASLFTNAEILQAFVTTILLAVLSSLIAVILGTMACIAMDRMKKMDRQLMLGEDAAPDDLAARALEVTGETVAEIARGVELDAVYFLKGESADE